MCQQDWPQCLNAPKKTKEHQLFNPGALKNQKSSLFLKSSPTLKNFLALIASKSGFKTLQDVPNEIKFDELFHHPQHIIDCDSKSDLD